MLFAVAVKELIVGQLATVMVTDCVALCAAQSLLVTMIVYVVVEMGRTSKKRWPGGIVYVLVSPPMEVICTLEIFEDSFQVRRDVWPASIRDGDAEKLVTDGGCPMRMVTLAVVGKGGEAAVHDPDLVAVIV